MRITIVLAFLVGSSLLGSAQDYVDLAKFTYLNSPFNRYSNADTVVDVARVQEFYLDLTVPIKLQKGHAIITGITLEQLSLQTAPEGYNVNQVFSTALKMGMNYKHSEKLEGTYLFMPKFSSDFHDIGRKDLQLGGLVLYKYHKKEFLKYRFGMYYNSELFGPFFVPLVGFWHRSKNKKFEANVTLPVWVDLNYRFTKWFTAGLNFSSFVRSYYLTPHSTQGREEYLVKASNELYAYGQFHLTKSVLLQGKIGYSIGRRFAAYDVEDRVTFGFMAFRFGDDRDRNNGTFSDGLIFQGRLIYRFDLSKAEPEPAPIPGS
ncbi:hypothetical protein KFE98_10185 [bacterium SCSIO 12741]|nr:hypothetical protein KFE98_10185 [bacterium SCSIO 12741]